MTGSSDAAASLKASALAHYEAMREAVSAVSRAVLGLRGADDLVEVMREVDRFSLACESLAQIAKAVHEDVDQALAACMNETGAPAFRTEAHTVSTRRNPAAVEIVSPDAVPEEMMSTPAPRPDKTRVRAHLRDHPETNWAVLLEGGIGLQRRPIT